MATGDPDPFRKSLKRVFGPSVRDMNISFILPPPPPLEYSIMGALLDDARRWRDRDQPELEDQALTMLIDYVQQYKNSCTNPKEPIPSSKL